MELVNRIPIGLRVSCGCLSYCFGVLVEVTSGKVELIVEADIDVTRDLLKDINRHTANVQVLRST